MVLYIVFRVGRRGVEMESISKDLNCVDSVFEVKCLAGDGVKEPGVCGVVIIVVESSVGLLEGLKGSER